MSRIEIECDGCMDTRKLPVRQNHEARKILAVDGWTHRDTSSRFGNRMEDYCPKCS